MILLKERVPHFVTIFRGATLNDSDHEPVLDDQRLRNDICRFVFDF